MSRDLGDSVPRFLRSLSPTLTDNNPRSKRRERPVQPSGAVSRWSCLVPDSVPRSSSLTLPDNNQEQRRERPVQPSGAEGRPLCTPGHNLRFMMPGRGPAVGTAVGLWVCGRGRTSYTRCIPAPVHVVAGAAAVPLEHMTCYCCTSSTWASTCIRVTARFSALLAQQPAWSALLSERGD